MTVTRVYWNKGKSAPALLPTPPTELRGVVCEAKEMVDLDNGRSVLMAKSIRLPKEDQLVSMKIKNSFVEFHLEIPDIPRRGSCPGQLEKFEYNISPRRNTTSQNNVNSQGNIQPHLKDNTTTTTYMIRNIPTRFTSITFVRLLDEYGFHDTFDFFYLPMDFRSGKNMGYAFINFRSGAVGAEFARKLHQKRLPVSTSRKVIEVAPSRRQGLMDNIALFRTSDLLSSISLPHYKPLISTGAGKLVPLSDENFPQEVKI